MGRPLKFASVKELQEKIDAYFAQTPPTQQTITGLALALDTYRDVLMDYQSGKYDDKGKSDNDNRDFSNTIKRAKTRIENAYELSLRTRGSAGDIFGLKNFGWKDKTESEITNPDGSLNPYNALTAEELRKLADK